MCLRRPTLVLLIAALIAGCGEGELGGWLEVPAFDAGASGDAGGSEDPDAAVETTPDAVAPVVDAAVEPPLGDAAPEPPTDAAPEPPPDAAGEPPPPPPPPFATLPWTELGTGVAFKDSQNPAGEAVFIGYAGYQVTDDEARAWVSALYEAALAEYGVRYVYAVRGPRDVQYDARELSNSRMARDFVPRLAGHDAPILIAAHSSGAWVACELFEQLFEGGFDPAGEAQGRVVYYDLDGIGSCLPQAAIDAFRGLYFTHAVLGDGVSLQSASMVAAHERWPDQSALLTYDAAETGCHADARMCLHISLVNTRPHDPAGADRTADYTDFDGRPVNRWYLDATRDLLLP
jgi:hypothetical protein